MTIKLIGEKTKEMQKYTKQQQNISKYSPANIETLNEASEISETIKELNNDTLDHDGFSPIDMKTRLNKLEISSLIAIDSLVALDFLPIETSFITRSKKRLAVSENGQGRSEIVDITGRMREEKQGTSAFSKIKGMFGMGGD